MPLPVSDKHRNSQGILNESKTSPRSSQPGIWVLFTQREEAATRKASRKNLFKILILYNHFQAKLNLNSINRQVSKLLNQAGCPVLGEPPTQPFHLATPAGSRATYNLQPVVTKSRLQMEFWGKGGGNGEGASGWGPGSGGPKAFLGPCLGGRISSEDWLGTGGPGATVSCLTGRLEASWVCSLHLQDQAKIPGSEHLKSMFNSTGT